MAPIQTVSPGAEGRGHGRARAGSMAVAMRAITSSDKKLAGSTLIKAGSRTSASRTRKVCFVASTII